MTSFMQLLLLLILVMLTQSLILWLILRRYRKQNQFIQSSGVPIGTSVSNILDTYFSYKEKKFNTSYYLLFVDVDCQQCKRILEAFTLLDGVVSSLFHIIVREEQSIDNTYTKTYQGLSFTYLPDNIVFGNLGVKAFPYLLKIDKDGTVESKGYVTKGNLLEHL